MSEHLAQHRSATLIGLPFGKTLHWVARFGINDIHNFCCGDKEKNITGNTHEALEFTPPRPQVYPP